MQREEKHMKNYIKGVKTLKKCCKINKKGL